MTKTNKAIMTYGQAVEKVNFLKEWDGIKGYRHNGVRVATSNGAIKKGDDKKIINTPLVKQVFQYANKDFHKIMKNGGFVIKYSLGNILFSQVKGQYLITVQNSKTKAMNTYALDSELTESNKALEIPLRELQELLTLEVYSN